MQQFTHVVEAESPAQVCTPPNAERSFQGYLVTSHFELQHAAFRFCPVTIRVVGIAWWSRKLWRLGRLENNVIVALNAPGSLLCPIVQIVR